MTKIMQLKNKDKTGNIKNVGTIEIKNQTDERAELYFYGDIVSNSWQSYWFEEDKCPQDISNFLKELDNSKAIDIFINSGGGSVHGGLAIYNMLKRYSGEKTVHIDGLAASIASIIAMAGDKIIIPQNAQLMIHKPSCYLWDCYNADNLRSIADSLDTCQKSILAIYMENVKEGITEEEITEMINKETWFTGDEAEKYFNIEVENQGELVACTSDYFDKYKNTPKSLLNKSSQNINTDEITNKVLKIIEDKQKSENEEIKNKIEKEKTAILEDLDFYGI
ncbi:TPA: Clp protease ClpP [Clostridium botulinum]|nr:Clp protease ClpP [Clostridium botulinum]